MALFPYRWMPSTVGKNLRYASLSIISGVSNIIRWTPIIWDDADFDWEFLARIMEYKMRRMAKHHATHNLVVGAERYARQLTTCAELLKRLREDDYPNRGPRRPYDRAWADHWTYMVEQDKVLLGNMIGKYLNHWWD